MSEPNINGYQDDGSVTKNKELMGLIKEDCSKAVDV